MFAFSRVSPLHSNATWVPSGESAGKRSSPTSAVKGVRLGWRAWTRPYDRGEDRRRDEHHTRQNHAGTRAAT